LTLNPNNDIFPEVREAIVSLTPSYPDVNFEEMVRKIIRPMYLYLSKKISEIPPSAADASKRLKERIHYNCVFIAKLARFCNPERINDLQFSIKDMTQHYAP